MGPHKLVNNCICKPTNNAIDYKIRLVFPLDGFSHGYITADELISPQTVEQLTTPLEKII
jgi:hypothetical protein